MLSDREMILIQQLYLKAFSFYTMFFCLPSSQYFPKCEMPSREWYKEKVLNNMLTKLFPFSFSFLDHTKKPKQKTKNIIPLLNMLASNSTQLGYFSCLDLPPLDALQIVGIGSIKECSFNDIIWRLFQCTKNVPIPYCHMSFLFKGSWKTYTQRRKGLCFISLAMADRTTGT